jgi:sulfur carrier protein
MMLIINGRARESASTSVAELWHEETSALNLESPKGYAIALNGGVIRKDAWSRTVLADGDRIEIVRAIQGG